jgi:CHAT domain-containing protein
MHFPLKNSVLMLCVISLSVLLSVAYWQPANAQTPLDRDIERADSLFRTGWIIEAAELSRSCKQQLGLEKYSPRYAKNLLTEAWCTSYINSPNAFDLAKEVFELYDKTLKPKDIMLHADASHLYWWEYAWATKDYNSSHIKLNELLQVYRNTPLEQSEVYRTISRLHRAQKDFPKALRHIDLAEKAVPIGSHGANYQLARIYNSYSAQYFEMNNDSLFADYTQRAWDLFKKQTPDNHFWLEQLADRMFFTAGYHFKKLDLVRATQSYMAARPFFEKRQPTDPNLSHIYSSLESLLGLQGYPFAVKLYHEKNKKFAESLKNNAPKVTPNDTKFGIKLTALQTAAAAGNQKEVIAQGKILLAELQDSTKFHHIGLKNHICQLMASAYQNLNDISAAKYYTELAVEVIKNSPLYGDHLMSLAMDASKNHEWRKSIELNRQAVAVYQKTGDSPIKLVMPLSNMAISYNLEQLTNGAFDMKKGKAKFLSVFDSLCYYSNQVVRAAVISPLTFHSAFQGYADLGRFHWMHYLHTGEVNSLNAAKYALDSADWVMKREERFSLTGLIEIGSSKINLINFAQAQELNAQVHLKLHEITQKSEYIESAFKLSEFNRSVNLRSGLIVNRINAQYANVFTPELSHYLVAANQSKSSISSNNDMELDILIRGFDQFYSLEHGNSEESQRYREAKYGNKPSGIRQVQERLLENNQTFVEYGKTIDDRWYAYVVGKNSYKVVYLHQESDSIVNRLVDHYLALRNNHETGTVSDKLKTENIRKFQEAAQQLHKLFIQPIENDLSERVIVAAFGSLSSIPFDFLMSGSPKISGKYSKEDPYILHRYAFSYVYSAQILDLMRENTNWNKSSASDVFRAFVPYFNSQEELPSGPPTANTCKNIFGGQVHENQGASADAFQTITTGSASRILLLYQHGNVNVSTLDSAYIQFTKMKEQATNTLNNQSIYKMRIKSDLVFLASCFGAQGKTDGLEGIVSIARAFTYAGAGSVIACQWKMDDNTAGAFIPAFFKLSKAPNTPKDVALAQAKRNALLAPQGNPDPWYFGSFVLYGDSRPLF